MNRIKHILILIVDSIGLLIIISIVLLLLNYFKILPLSTAFPTTLGWLPVATEEAGNDTEISASPNGLAWNKADPALFANYADYFKTRFASESAITKPNGIIEDSVLIGFNANFIQVLVPHGSRILRITDNTQFNKFSPPTTTKQNADTNAERLILSYKTASDFFKEVSFGDFLKITYKILPDADLEAVSINYYPEHKF